jgi:hypothetical protein
MKILAKLENGVPNCGEETSLILGNYANMLLGGKLKEFLNVQNDHLHAKYLLSKNHMDILAHLIGKYTESAKSRPPLLCID